MTTEQVAYRMFARNVIDYAHPAMIELAWADPEVRAFWLAEAESITNDLLRPPRLRYRRRHRVGKGMNRR